MMKRISIRRRSAIIIGFAIALVSATSALASGAGQAAHSPAAHLRSKAETPASAGFKAFRSSAAPTDALPTDVSSGLAPLIAQENLDVASSRLIGTLGSLQAWAVSGPSEVCLVFSDGTGGGSAACGDAAGAGQNGLFASRDGAFIGLFPSDVATVSVSTGQGTSSSFSPNSSGGVVATLTGTVTGVQLLNASGEVISSASG